VLGVVKKVDNKNVALDTVFVVYYETIQREVSTRLIYECRCDERLKS
jgi:hypothetical protein